MGIILYFVLFLLIILSLYNITRNSQYELSNITFSFKRVHWSFFLIVSIILYTLIRTVSYDTGADYLAYYNHFITRSRNLIDVWGEGREIGYQYLIDFLSSYFGKPNIFFALCSILGIGTLTMVSMKFGKAAPYIVLGWVLYMFNLSMNLYRQYLAMSLIFCALYFLINFSHKRKRIMYSSICVILAYFFHHSSAIGVLMLILIFMLGKYKIKKWVFISMLLITTISAMTVLSNFFSLVGSYFDAYIAMNDRGYSASEMLDSMYDTGKMAYVNMLCGVIFIWYGDRVLDDNVTLRYFYLIFVICLIITPLTQEEILMRMRLYLTNFSVIGYGLIVYFNKRLYSLKSNLPLFGVVIYQFLYMFIYQNSLLFENFPIQFKY